MKKSSILIISCLFLASICYADDISISADVDRNEIAMDEQVTLTITVSGNVTNIPEPKIPALKGFTTYSAGRSQNISIINGQVSSSISFNYILVPNDVGDYSVGPFSIDYKGQTYSAGPIQIKVVSKAQRQRPQQPAYQPRPYPQPSPYPQAPPEERAYPEEAKELFIETYVDKLRAYVNEQITLTFAFYQAVELFENPVYSPPSTTGFWVEDMPPQKKYYKTINGKQYLVTEIKTALFATSPGEFTIGPARLEATVEDLQRFFSKSPFDIFDRDIFRSGKPVILTTEPIKVEILPLPEEGKPSNFAGDVGQYNISATVDKNSVEENQPITLKIKIEGKGNIKTISGPQIPPMDNVKFYDSGSSEKISKADYVVQGEKVFEKVIIPQREGQFTLGPITYSYFDPAEKRYILKTINPVTITATRAKVEKAPESLTISFAGLSKEEIRLLKQDIRYIKTTSLRLRDKDKFLYKDGIFVSINLLSLLLLPIFYFYQSHRVRLRSDRRYARSRRAKGFALKHLKNARAFLAQNKTKEFYAEIQNSIVRFITDRLNLPIGSLTISQIETILKQSQFDDNIIKRLKAILESCDIARFASASFDQEDLKKAFQEANEILNLLEKRL